MPKACQTYGVDTFSASNTQRCQKYVHQMQRRLDEAVASNDKRKIRWYTHLLSKRSKGAKILAVYQVTVENKGKYTAGIDGVCINRDGSREEMCEGLKSNCVGVESGGIGTGRETEVTPQREPGNGRQGGKKIEKQSVRERPPRAGDIMTVNTEAVIGWERVFNASKLKSAERRISERELAALNHIGGWAAVEGLQEGDERYVPTKQRFLEVFLSEMM